MASRLLGAGFDVTVYNRTRERAEPLAAKGAHIADSPREAVRDAEVIITMVADDIASRAVWIGDNGMLAEVKHGAICIESSTLSVPWVRELASRSSPAWMPASRCSRHRQQSAARGRGVEFPCPAATPLH